MSLLKMINYLAWNCGLTKEYKPGKKVRSYTKDTEGKLRIEFTDNTNVLFSVWDLVEL